jgi:ribosomal-protein-alanine N-acetyltransferase
MNTKIRAVGNVQIRSAVDADIPAISAIERASFSDPWSETSFRSMLGHETVYLRVAEQQGTVVGYCVAWIVADEAEVANLAVVESARRQGIGVALLDDLLTRVDAAPGVKASVYLEVRASNVAAQALYVRRGFVPTGRRKGYYKAPVEDAVVMKRRGL